MNIKIIIWTIVSVLIAHNTKAAQDLIEYAFLQAQQGKYEQAIIIIKNNPESIESKILMTRAILDSRCSHIDFVEAVSFAINNPQWPQIDFIKSRIEKLIKPNTDKSKVFNWFNKNSPRTSIGWKHYALSIPFDLEKSKKDEIIKKCWIYGSFAKDEAEEFLRQNFNILTPTNHQERINELLWNSNTKEAKQMLHLIDKKLHKRLLVRIAIIDKDPKAEKFFKFLKHSDKFNTGVLHSYLKSKKATKLPVTTNELHLSLQIPSCKARADQWWEVRNYYIRELMDKHRYSQAYHLAANHFCRKRLHITQAEWLCGFLSLRFLHNPKVALVHFKRLHANCSRPVSLSRGAYWIARSYKAMKDMEKAKHWFNIASQHGHTFYGQLAQSELNYKYLNLAKKTTAFQIKNLSIEEQEGLSIIKLLAQHDQKNLIQPYIESIFKNSQNPGYIRLIITELDKTNYTDLKVEVARRATFYGVLSLKHGYPVLDYVEQHDPLVPKPLLHSIIRQESSFNVSATDPTGGFGLMQLLLPTAQKTAKLLNIEYDKDKLLQNHEYNIKLGSKHLADHIEYYKKSYLLGIPAYNAGAHRVNEWINRYGDPRKFKTIYSIIDWTERLPYHTTRDYIHRIIENVQIYKLLIDGNNKLSIIEDLKFKA